MADNMHGLRLTEEEEGFVLSTTEAGENITRIKLTSEQVFALAQSAPFFGERARSKLQTSGVGIQPVLVTPVMEIFLNVDSLEESILMMPVARNGNRLIFELTPSLAEDLASRLPIYVARVRSTLATQ